MQFRWRKSIGLIGLAALLGFLSLLLGCTGSGALERATAVPANNNPELIVFYTDN